MFLCSSQGFLLIFNELHAYYMLKFKFIIGFLCLNLILPAQEYHPITGTVTDKEGKPLTGCHVHIDTLCCITDIEGRFIHEFRSGKQVSVKFSYIGFKTIDTLINSDQYKLDIQLEENLQQIQAVSIKAQSIDTAKSLQNEVFGQVFITRNYSGTFIKSIERLPGINSMDIGAGASKPVIRGLGFNRIVVSENGIKQEGQQWGADHGLELDPFSIEIVEVLKGPSAIEYGSDAIGGYINVTNTTTPAKNSIKAEASLLAKSVNNTFGSSLAINGREDHFFFKIRATALTFGDYKIPTDTILYLTRKIPVYNQKLKNTAGNEYDWYTQLGWVNNRFKSILTISQVNQLSGFFPGSHGIPDLNRVLSDGDSRNIDFPNQKASHLKVLHNSRLFLNPGILYFDLAAQHNHRQEWSEFHTHYPEQDVTLTNENLELDFQLRAYQANVKLVLAKTGFHKISIGIQNQWKKNTIAGYNFLLPEYSSYSGGIFVKDELKINNKLKLNLALRYDMTDLKTIAYYDSVVYRYISLSSTSDPELYAQRSSGIQETFHDFSWLAGGVFTPSSKSIYRFNLGKAFRPPSPIELGSNGIHHGSFRHEVGDSTLSSEQGFYIDASGELYISNISISVNPYLYYFSNYIYLRPTGEWSELPHSGQVYKYTETKALLSGIEFSINQIIAKSFSYELILEYIYNKQIQEDFSKQYPLPFTPPVNGFAEIKYELKETDILQNNQVFLNSKVAMKQDHISRNELETPGYVLFGMGVSTQIQIDKNKIDITLMGNNLLNVKYFNHISFYRKLNIPEPGRNFQVLVKIPFNNN